MCVPCKVIINNGLAAISKSLETILLSPQVRGKLISEEEAEDVLDRLLDLDVIRYHGFSVRDPEAKNKVPPCYGLADILLELQQKGVFTEEIWTVFKHPLIQKGHLESPKGAEV